MREKLDDPSATFLSGRLVVLFAVAVVVCAAAVVIALIMAVTLFAMPKRRLRSLRGS